MNAAEVMADVAARLVAAMEAGAGDWSMPWRTIGDRGWPTNAVTGARYRGGNVLALAMATVQRGYPTAQWATFKQWASCGGQVRRGERGSHAIFWHITTTLATAEGDDSASAEDSSDDVASAGRVGWARSFTVFNAAQVDHADPTDPTDTAVGADLATDGWFAAIPATVIVGGDRAYYHPAADTVHVPALELFDSPDAAYATRAHELAHWSGHPDRLAREFGRRFGDRAYAVEELVAELSAAFTCATVGIATVARLDHAAYLAHWCQILREQPNVLWTVASRAQAATEYLDAFSTGEVAA